MRNLKWIKCGMVMACLMLVCLPISVQAGEGSMLVVGLQAEPASMDPPQISDYNSMRAVSELFDHLVEFKDGTTDIEPGLAKRWSVSADGLEFTFHLREGVNFHDGTPFNAESVKFSIERQTDPKHPYHDTGTFPYAEFTFGMVKTVKVVDQKTVKIILKQSYAPFLANMAMHSASIVSPAAVKKFKKDFSQNPVGTGPYQFVKWDPGVEVVIKRNDSYWKKKPQVQTIIYRPIVDDQARITELEAGRIDFMVGILPDDLKRLRKNTQLKIQEQAGMHTWYLVMNCSRPPFNDVRVRQALNYAVNKKAIVDYILQGTGKLARNLLPPVIWSYTDDVPTYAYNPEKAKKLLMEAGLKKGLRVDFYVPESGSGMQQPVTMATAIQSDLASVGIKVDIKQLEWGTYLDKVLQPVDKNEILLYEMSWIGDNGDPDNFLYILASGDQWPTAGYNGAFYKNKKADEFLRKARTVTDVSERTKLYEKAQKMIMADSPIVVVDHESQIVAMKKKVKNFILHPTGVFRFRNVTIE